MRYVRPSSLLCGFHADNPDAGVPELVHVGEQWAPSAYLIPEHAHPVWEFYLQVDGESRWISWERPRRETHYLLTPGHFFAAPPRVRHALAERPRDKHHFFFAALDLRMVLARCPGIEPAWQTGKCLCIAGAHGLLGPFRQLVREVSARLPLRTLGLRRAVDFLVIEASRLSLTERAESRRTGKLGRRGRTPGAECHIIPLHPSVQVVRELLEQQFCEPWRLADLGRLAGLSPNHLAQLFGKEVGVSPHQYLLRQRIERAKELLAGTDVPITRIALDLGFSSSQHFARVFHQNVKRSARAYRDGSQRRK